MTHYIYRIGIMAVLLISGVYALVQAAGATHYTPVLIVGATLMVVLVFCVAEFTIYICKDTDAFKNGHFGS